MNAIFTRRSIRKYQRKDVEEEKIRKILWTGMSALSEGNQRHWEFYVVKNLDTKRKLSEASPFAGCAKDAPVCFVLCYRKECRYPDYVQIDLSATADNMLNEAEQLGPGAVLLGIAPLKKRLKASKMCSIYLMNWKFLH